MASAMRKMAVYLGLVEDDRRYQDSYDAYDEYDEYDEPARGGGGRAGPCRLRRLRDRAAA